jgi:hypothetical protein
VSQNRKDYQIEKGRLDKAKTQKRALQGINAIFVPAIYLARKLRYNFL